MTELKAESYPSDPGSLMR